MDTEESSCQTSVFHEVPPVSSLRLLLGQCQGVIPAACVPFSVLLFIPVLRVFFFLIVFRPIL